MSERPELDLSLLGQAMRERGLHVDRVTTIDPRFINGENAIPYSITVWWNGDVDGYHRRTAEYLAQPIEKLWHENPRAHSAKPEPARPTHAPATPDAPRIVNLDGTTRTYVVGKGWVDAV